jgi:hypothetical protein
MQFSNDKTKIPQRTPAPASHVRPVQHGQPGYDASSPDAYASRTEGTAAGKGLLAANNA